MSERVFVTGVGCVIPKALNAEAFWHRMVRAESSLERVTRFDASEYRTQIAGELTADISTLVGFNVRASSRNAQFAVAAALETLRDARILDDPSLSDTGICLGSGLGGVYFSEESIKSLLDKGPRGVSPYEVPYVDPNGIVNQVAIRWGMRGAQMTISSACSSSAHAIGHALDMIRAGRCDAVLAGGVEATISPLIFAGFDRIRAMSARNSTPHTACRPFSDDRDGFVMSEGAAMLFLESESHARRRGARILAELKGYGACGGAYHAVAPRPNGEDLVVAMHKALADGGVGPDEVDLINPHGTGTRLNDDAEAIALRTVFGDRLDDLAITPIKQLTGHLLGASAALESVHVVKSIQASFVTPVQHYQSTKALRVLCGQGESRTLRNVINNSFGFGNNNASLVFGAYP